MVKVYENTEYNVAITTDEMNMLNNGELISFMIDDHKVTVGKGIVR